MQPLTTQKYTTNLGKRPSYDAVITIPNDDVSYRLDQQLGIGAYGVVHSLKKRKTLIDETAGVISYKTQEVINADYVIKQMHDISSYTVKLSDHTKEILRIPTDIENYASNLLLFTDRHFVTAARDAQYQMAVEEKLRQEIEDNTHIDEFLTHKKKQNGQMLQELESEASYITRYYARVGTSAIILESQPNASVSFNCQHAYASIHYHPAIALLMPKVSGVSLWNYPKKYFDSQFSFAFLLTLFTKIMDEFKHLHALDILHLDASPNNIMFDPDKDQVRFVDFGTAKDRLDSHGNPASIPRVSQDTPYDYWRKDRLRPVQSDSSNVIVGIEDDAFSLVACMSYLAKEYQRRVKSITIAACFTNYLEQIKAALDHPGVSMPDVFSSIYQVVSLMNRLLESHEIKGLTVEYISQLDRELEKTKPLLGESSDLFREALNIINSAKNFSSANTYKNKNPNIGSRNSAFRVSTGIFQKKKNVVKTMSAQLAPTC